VRLRSGSGLLVRDVLVATLPQEWEQPGVRFAGPQTIEVIDEGGKVHRSTFWPTSLKVDPVYHPHDFF